MGDYQTLFHVHQWNAARLQEAQDAKRYRDADRHRANCDALEKAMDAAR